MIYNSSLPMGFHFYMSLGFSLILLVSAGALSGLLAGLLGVGGGIIIVPVLFTLLQMLGVTSASAMSIAVATSLAVITVTSVSSARAHSRQQNVDISLLKYWAPFIVAGALVGGLLAPLIGGRVLVGMFGVIAIVFAVNMLASHRLVARFKHLPGRSVQAAFAIMTGLISALVGIGGGTFGVSILSACSYRAHVAIGTSSVFGVLIALPAVVVMTVLPDTPVDAPYGTVGFLSWVGFLLIAPISVFVAPLGARLAAYLAPEVLKRTFLVFLLLSGVKMVYQAFWA